MKLKVRASALGHVSLSPSRDPWGLRRAELEADEVRAALNCNGRPQNGVESTSARVKNKKSCNGASSDVESCFPFSFFFANVSGGVRRRGDPYPRTALTAIRKLRKLRTRFCREKRRALHAAGQSSAVCGLRFIAPSWEYSRWPARILNSFR